MAVDPITTTIAASAVGAATGKAVDNVAARIPALFARSSHKVSLKDKISAILQVGFKPYLRLSYQKCKYFKSVLDGSRPLDLTENYIHVDVSTAGKGGERVPDEQFIHELPKLNRVVINGLAGSGKSMLMKYITLTYFKKTQEAIPLFVEMRNINEFTNGGFINFLLAQCSKTGDVSVEQFSLALRHGIFFLVLDGFDEIEYEIRDKVSNELSELGLAFPDLLIVISSRPDDRFSAWSDYHVFDVCRLTREQTIELVKKLNAEEGLKRRFLKSIESKLFETHQSFLESPLLTSIMLLTFEEYADVPTKMHAFYANAFDTLFQKHDADKEQYTRKIKTKLSREEFKLAFSVFCAVSYMEERFSFSAGQLMETANTSVRYLKKVSNAHNSLRTVDLICDLRDAVCMIQPDGLQTIFVHRSFQEYFTAVFVDKTTEQQAKLVMDRVAPRFNDSVIPMALDMSREKMERAWVLPTVENCIEFFSRSKRGSRSTGKIFGALFDQVAPYKHKDGIRFHFFELNSVVLGPIELICRAYGDLLGPTFLIRSIKKMKFSTFRKMASDSTNKNRGGYSKLLQYFSDLAAAEKAQSGIPLATFKISEKDSWWLNILGFETTFDELHKRLVSLKGDIEDRARERDAILRPFMDV